jgi:hypothetical protein
LKKAEPAFAISLGAAKQPNAGAGELR